jgi:hypothetical protein
MFDPVKIKLDLEYIAKVVATANKAGLMGRELDKLEAVVTKDGVQIKLVYKKALSDSVTRRK